MPIQALDPFQWVSGLSKPGIFTAAGGVIKHDAEGNVIWNTALSGVDMVVAAPSGKTLAAQNEGNTYHALDADGNIISTGNVGTDDAGDPNEIIGIAFSEGEGINIYYMAPDDIDEAKVLTPSGTVPVAQNRSNLSRVFIGPSGTSILVPIGDQIKTVDGGSVVSTTTIGGTNPDQTWEIHAVKAPSHGVYSAGAIVESGETDQGFITNGSWDDRMGFVINTISASGDAIYGISAGVTGNATLSKWTSAGVREWSAVLASDFSFFNNVWATPNVIYALTEFATDIRRFQPDGTELDPTPVGGTYISALPGEIGAFPGEW